MQATSAVTEGTTESIAPPRPDPERAATGFTSRERLDLAERELEERRDELRAAEREVQRRRQLVEAAERLVAQRRQALAVAEAESAPAPASPVPAAEAPHEPAAAASQVVPFRAAGSPRAHDGAGWLGEALRHLAGREPEAAGRALVDLLPLQGRVFGANVSYDLVLDDGPWLAVSVDDRGTEIRTLERPRPIEEVDARVESSYAELGELARARGGLLRRRPEARAQGRGRRQAQAALHALAGAQLRLGDLAGPGVEMAPRRLLDLVAQAIDPSWTIGHRLSVAFDIDDEGELLILQVNDGSRPSVTRGLTLARPVATVRCARRALPAVLLGHEDAAALGAVMLGDRAGLMLVQGWVARLEAGRG